MSLTEANTLKEVAVVMGSDSDLKTLQPAVAILNQFGISNEVRILSAHRTPKEMTDFAQMAESNGFGVIIAGAGGAAHLPGMIASLTTLPVIGVPVKSKALSGIDSMYSILQPPQQNASLVLSEISVTVYSVLQSKTEIFSCCKRSACAV